MTEQDKASKSTDEPIDNAAENIKGAIISGNDVKARSTEEQKRDIGSAEYIAP